MRIQNILVVCLAAASLSCSGKGIDIERFEPVVRRDPTEADRHFNRGVALSLIERDEDAVQAFAEAGALGESGTGQTVEEAFAHSAVGQMVPIDYR